MNVLTPIVSSASKIVLTKGYVALVDAEDFGRVNAHKWTAMVHDKGSYKRVYAYRKQGGKNVYLHQFILGSKRVDHHDHDGLNNQRYNLRGIGQSGNIANARKTTKTKSSLFKGVFWCTQRQKWMARIKLHGKAMHIGTFKDEVDAATAYNFKAFELFGEFAHCNVPRAA